MKKLFWCALGLLLCLVAGCKKDGQRKKVYLLTQQITDDRIDGYPIDTTRYTYDDQDQLVSVKEGLAHQQKRFMLSYDTKGRIVTVLQFNSTDSLENKYDFFYTSAIGYYFHDASGAPDSSVISLNSKNQVTTIKSANKGYGAFTYDAAGNITSLKNFDANGTDDLYDESYYKYDTKKNPFSQSAPNNYFLMYILYADASTLINNITVKNADTYDYTYNSDDFPVSVMVNIGRGIKSIYYTYTVK